MRLGVFNGLGCRKNHLAVVEEGAEALEHLQHVVGAPFSQALAAGDSQGCRDAAEGGQRLVFIGGTGHHHQVAVRCGLVPEPELLQSVTPMAPATEQTDQHQSCAAQAGADVVIQHRGVLEARQVQALELTALTGREVLPVQRCGQRRQVGVRA